MSTILNEIVNGKRLPVLFIGSGISRRYLNNYPNWTELLTQSFSEYNKDIFQLQNHINRLTLDEKGDFYVNTNLATIIEQDYNDAFFNRKIKLNIGNPKNPSWVKRGISPYKMFLCKKFKKMKLTNTPALLNELDQFKLLKNKISAVITTNYDLFLESHVFSEDFTIFTKQEDLFSPESYNIAEIYKIHGSATDANSLVVTKRDYDKFFNAKKLLVAKMLTLFAESPIIFLGYSLTDENILSIITDFLECISENDRNNIHKHFIFISWKENEQNLVEIRQTITTANGTTVPVTEIQTDNFSKVFEILNEITPGISPIKVRETKRVIKNIVDASMTSSEAESILIEVDDLDKVDLSSKPLAIAIGYKENMLGKLGYGILDDTLIIEDILFDNKHFDSTKMCFERYKSIPSTRLLPVFKYVRNCPLPIPDSTKLSAYIAKHNTLDLIRPKTCKKNLKNFPIVSTYTSLIDECELQVDLNKKAGVLLNNIENFSVKEIREYCKMLFTENSEDDIKLSTNYKRCVMYLDLSENYTQ